MNKIGKSYFTTFLKLCSSKNAIEKTERQITDREEIVTTCTSGKRLGCGIYKGFLQREDNSIEKGGDSSPKTWSTLLVIREMQIKIAVRSHCAHLLEWLKLKRLTIPSAGEDVGQLEPCVSLVGV